MRPDDSFHIRDIAPPTQDSPRFTLREFLVIAFKDRKRITAGFFIPLLLVIAISFIPTPRYEAISTVLVRMGREYMYRPEVGDSNTQPIAPDREEALHSEVEIIGSRDQLESVIDQLGVAHIYPIIADSDEDPELPKRSRAILELQKRLDILLLKDTNIIQISFKHPDPQISAEVVNRLVDNYLEKRRGIFSDAKVAFSEKQAKVVYDQLNALEAKIEAFKRDNNIVSLPEQLSLLLNQRDEIQKRLNDANTELIEAIGKLSTDSDTTDSLESQMLVQADANEAIESARKSLADLHDKEHDALIRYTESHPMVVDLRKNIQQAEKHLHDLETKWTESVRSTLKAQLASINAQIDGLNARDRELNNLLRERQLLDASYQNYVKKLDEARVTENLDRKEKTSVSIVQRALPPIEKSHIQLIVLIVGFFFSGCCALVVAFLSEMLRDTFISPEKAERMLGLPVLASFPYQDMSPNRRKR